MPRQRKSRPNYTFQSFIRGVFFGEAVSKRRPRVVLAKIGSMEGAPAAPVPETKPEEKSNDNFEKKITSLSEKSDRTELEDKELSARKIAKMFNFDIESMEQDLKLKEKDSPGLSPDVVEATRLAKELIQREIYPQGAEVSSQEPEPVPEVPAGKKRGGLTSKTNKDIIKDWEKGLQEAAEEIPSPPPIPEQEPEPLPGDPEVEQWERISPPHSTKGEVIEPLREPSMLASEAPKQKESREEKIARWEEEWQKIREIISQSGPDPERQDLLDAYGYMEYHNYDLQKIQEEIKSFDAIDNPDDLTKNQIRQLKLARKIMEGEEVEQPEVVKQEQAAPPVPENLPIEEVKTERQPESVELKEKIDELLNGELLDNTRAREAAQKVVETRAELLKAWPEIFEKRRKREIKPRANEGRSEEVAYDQARDALVAVLKAEKQGVTREDLAASLAKVDVGEELRLVNLKQEALPSKWVGWMNKLAQYYDWPFKKVFGEKVAKKYGKHIRIGMSALAATGIGAASGMGIGALAAYGGYRLTMPYLQMGFNAAAQLGIRRNFENKLEKEMQVLEGQTAEQIKNSLDINSQFMNEQREAVRLKAEAISKKLQGSKRRKQRALVSLNIALVGTRALASLSEVAGAAPGSGLDDHLKTQGMVGKGSKAPSLSEYVSQKAAALPTQVTEAIKSISNEKIAAVDKDGLWGAAMDMKRKGDITLEQFNKAWAESTVDIKGKRVPISEAGFVRDAQLKFNTITNRFEVIYAGKHFKVGTNQDLYAAYEKTHKPAPEWLEAAVAKEKHIPTDLDKSKALAAFGRIRPVAEPPPELLAGKAGDFEKWLDNSYAKQSLADQAAEIRAAKTSAAELQATAQQVEPFNRKVYEDMANAADQRAKKMEAYPDHVLKTVKWSELEKKWMGKTGLSEQQFHKMEKWPIEKFRDAVQGVESRGRVSAFEKSLAHNKGAADLWRYIEKNGGKGMFAMRVEEFFKKTI